MTIIKVNDPELQEKLNHTLFIGLSSSSCGKCGRPAFLDRKTHDEIAGWAPSSKGCEVEWKYVTSTYVGDGLEDRVKSLRPDLEFFDFMDIYKRKDVPQE